MNSYFKFSIGLFIGLLSFFSPRAFALTEVVIEIKDHLFLPAECSGSSGEKGTSYFHQFRR